MNHTPTRFTLIPPIKFASETISLNFTGPNNFSKSFDVTVWINHSMFVDLNKNAPPLNYQVIATEAHSMDTISLNVTSGLNETYYANANLLKSINYVDGSNWAKILSNVWNLEFSITPPTKYGIFEATLNLSYENKNFSYPLILANSKGYKQTIAFNRITITPSSATKTTDFEHIWDNCYPDSCSFTIFTAKPISNWIKNVQYTHPLNENNYYNYEIDLEKLSEINPRLGGIPDGIITLSNTDGSDTYSVAHLPVDLNIPHVFYADVKKAKANIPFEQTIHGALYYFTGVEIIKLEKDSNGQYTQESDKFFHSVAQPYLPVDLLTFEMPALAKGIYKLNFSGIFSKHYPNFLLEIE